MKPLLCVTPDGELEIWFSLFPHILFPFGFYVFMGENDHDVFFSQEARMPDAWGREIIEEWVE